MFITARTKAGQLSNCRAISKKWSWAQNYANVTQISAKRWLMIKSESRDWEAFFISIGGSKLIHISLCLLFNLRSPRKGREKIKKKLRKFEKNSFFKTEGKSMKKRNFFKRLQGVRAEGVSDKWHCFALMRFTVNLNKNQALHTSIK